ncbi:uncharacterized protein HHUB_4247 (plasmid) [Halobacterium hubeiense]|uniref:Uncharacterized protein n=1 Tax=Halobacterium hubeiense TaxID=1407499 RepID=A0A0U5H8M8_9EURY|nr:hypothetical protein [Halobacterium hubeiense]CQH63994.1 uncharacterized protein HHUB_4247 [Halobacterium hubeiense]
MATVDTSSLPESIEDASDLELPEDREYDDEENAELDAALESAIQAAEKAGNLTLARRLKCELGSHYYEQKFDL